MAQAGPAAAAGAGPAPDPAGQQQGPSRAAEAPYFVSDAQLTAYHYLIFFLLLAGGLVFLALLLFFTGDIQFQRAVGKVVRRLLKTVALRQVGAATPVSVGRVVRAAGRVVRRLLDGQRQGHQFQRAVGEVVRRLLEMVALCQVRVLPRWVLPAAVLGLQLKVRRQAGPACQLGRQAGQACSGREAVGRAA